MSLREDETFVIESLAASFSTNWRPGENPPDAYLVRGAEETAVEISTLTQYVTDSLGTRPRLTDDTATWQLANSLDDELKDLIPDGHTIGLVLSSPILKLRKTKNKLAEILRGHASDLSSLQQDRKIEINGNPITIFLNTHGSLDQRKVSAVFMNRSSSPHILANVRQILEDRIITKAAICARLNTDKQIWLALFNDYWLTEADTYRNVLEQLPIQHPFQRILLINGDGAVHTLFER